MTSKYRLAASALAISVAMTSIGLGTGPAGAAMARRADAFVDSIGVGVHYGDGGTPYVEDRTLVAQRLEELGVHHVRSDFTVADPEVDETIAKLGAAGIDSTLIMGEPSEATDVLPQMLGEVKASLLGDVAAFEGPNEWSTSGDPNWKADLVAYQERLYREVNEDPVLAAVPVLGPSIVHNDQATLGDISAYLDDGNIHSYPEGEGPEYKLSYYLQRAALNSGSKPIEATETGYTNAINWTPASAGENKPISEAAAAVYLPRLFLEYWSRGITRTFAYELVDQREDPAHEEREKNFGLFRHDLSPKPAATALENLIAIVGDPGPGFTPGSLEYAIAGGGAQAKSVLMEKRDGSFYLALWRLQRIWNPDTKEPITAAPEPLEVTFPDGPVEYSVYEPTGSEAPVGSGGPTQDLSVEVGAGVTILKLQAPVETAPVSTPEAPASPSVPPATQTVPPPLDPLPPSQRSAPRCVVPKLAGRKLPAAKVSVRRAHCLPRTVAVVIHPHRPSAAEPTPRVTRSAPAAGTVLAANAPVKLFYKRPARR